MSDDKKGQINAIEQAIGSLESQTTTLESTINQLTATTASIRETLEAVQATLRETRKELELVKAEQPIVVPEITDEEMEPLEEAIDDYNMFLERLQERWSIVEDSASDFNTARDEVESKLEPIQGKLTDFVCGVPEGWLETEQGKAFAAYRGRFDVEIPEEADIDEPTAVEYIYSSEVSSYEFDDRHDIDLPEHVLPEILQKKEVEDLEESVEEEAARLTDCD